MKLFLAFAAFGVTATLGILTYRKIVETSNSITKTSNDYDAALVSIKQKLGI